MCAIMSRSNMIHGELTENCFDDFCNNDIQRKFKKKKQTFAIHLAIITQKMLTRHTKNNYFLYKF